MVWACSKSNLFKTPNNGLGAFRTYVRVCLSAHMCGNRDATASNRKYKKSITLFTSWNFCLCIDGIVTTKEHMKIQHFWRILEISSHLCHGFWRFSRTFRGFWRRPHICVRILEMSAHLCEDSGDVRTYVRGFWSCPHICVWRCPHINTIPLKNPPPYWPMGPY